MKVIHEFGEVQSVDNEEYEGFHHEIVAGVEMDADEEKLYTDKGYAVVRNDADRVIAIISPEALQ